MFKERPVLGIVVARGKSKRLPGKNVIKVVDKPLLSWTIDAALGSEVVDKIVLSTDDLQIAEVGRRSGIDEVIDRPVSLACDDTPMEAVIQHVLKVLNDRSEFYGHIILLQPTSPLRTSNHIDEAFALIEETDAKGSISVSRTEHPIEWMGKISTNGLLDSFFEQTELSKQSQAFDLSYQINGAVYIVPVDSFLEEKTLFLSTGMVAYIMDRTSSIDIDDKYDLRLAEWLLRQRKDE